MEKALVSLSLKTEDKASESKEPTPSQNPAPPQTAAPSAAQVPIALKGVSQSLLDRVGGWVDQLSWGSGFYLLLLGWNWLCFRGIIRIVEPAFSTWYQKSLLLFVILLLCLNSFWVFFRFEQRSPRNSKRPWPETLLRRSVWWWCHGSGSWQGFCGPVSLQRRNRL